jgi:hypothetical protein
MPALSSSGKRVWARLVLGTFGVVIALVGIAALIGSRLPVGHVATRSILLPAPAESVYAVISDFASAPSWRKDLTRVDVDPADPTGRARFTEVGSNGNLTMQLEESSPPSRMVTRIAGDRGDFGGAWAYAVAPEGSGTRLTITEHGEVYNPIFRFVSRYLMGHTATLDGYLTSLGRRYSIEVEPADAPVVPLR